MQLSINGKQMDLGDALRAHITDKLEDINEKYFGRAIEAIVTLSPEGSAFTKTHVSIRIGKDIMVRADAKDTDPYASFDSACEKVAKQMRRYKTRLRDHHERLNEDVYTAASHSVFESKDEAVEEEADQKEPVVVADMVTNIQTMSVAEAVMRLNLSGENALMFRNAQHDQLNMIYRRSDGNVGWVDPEGNQSAQMPTKKSA